jgi:putative endonuclease
VPYSYILECSDGTLYTGWTTDLQQRIEAHNSGQGAKYTRGRTPVKLVYFEQFDDCKMARGREYAIKKLTRIEKMQLITRFRMLNIQDQE